LRWKSCFNRSVKIIFAAIDIHSEAKTLFITDHNCVIQASARTSVATSSLVPGSSECPEVCGIKPVTTSANSSTRSAEVVR
jgi:hypothetical protein